MPFRTWSLPVSSVLNPPPQCLRRRPMLMPAFRTCVAAVKSSAISRSGSAGAVHGQGGGGSFDCCPAVNCLRGMQAHVIQKTQLATAHHSGFPPRCRSAIRAQPIPPAAAMFQSALDPPVAPVCPVPLRARFRRCRLVGAVGNRHGMCPQELGRRCVVRKPGEIFSAVFLFS